MQPTKDEGRTTGTVYRGFICAGMELEPGAGEWGARGRKSGRTPTFASIDSGRSSAECRHAVCCMILRKDGSHRAWPGGLRGANASQLPAGSGRAALGGGPGRLEALDGLAARKACVQLVPVADVGLSQAPAEVDGATVDLAGEVAEPIRALELDA